MADKQDSAKQTSPVQQDAKTKRRVRKPETIRERAAKTSAKAEAKAQKKSKSRVKRFFAAVYKPFKKPLRIITAPFRLRAVRAVGRFIGKILWPPYFRNSFREVRQVTWPSRSTTWKLTVAVIVFAVAFGALAAGTDFVLDKVIRRIVFRS